MSTPPIFPQVFSLSCILGRCQQLVNWTPEAVHASLEDLRLPVRARARWQGGNWYFYTQYLSLADGCLLWLRLEMPRQRGLARLSLVADIFEAGDGFVLWETDWLDIADPSVAKTRLAGAALRWMRLCAQATGSRKETAQRLATAAMRLDFNYKFVVGCDSMGSCLWELLPLTRTYTGCASAVLISKVGVVGPACCFLSPVLGFLQGEVALDIERHLEAGTVLNAQEAVPDYVLAGR